jgi:hypothetical protein
MGFVDGTGALCARRSQFICLPLIAAAVCWLLTRADARAQTVEADSPRGDVFAELIGGTLGITAGRFVGIGTGFVARQNERCVPGEEFYGVGPTLRGITAGVPGMLTLTPAGVLIAGAQTEGRGSYWAALCGAALGFGGMFASLATFAPTLDNAGVALTGFALRTLAGAVIGYRVSAPERVASRDRAGIRRPRCHARVRGAPMKRAVLRPGCLALLLLSLLGGATASAQSSPPSAASDSDTGAAQTSASPPSETTQTPAPPDAPLTPWRALQMDERSGVELTTARRRHGDPAGSLGWEIVGAVIPSLTGVALMVASFDSGSGGGHVPSFRVNLALLSFSALITLAGPPAGVAIAGSVTGGTGGAGYAFLGALAGLPLSLPGIVIGSIIGYRVSADDEGDRDESHCMIRPMIARHELELLPRGNVRTTTRVGLYFGCGLGFTRHRG